MTDALAAIPWQAAAWARLCAQAAADRLHHAILISGPSGIGKRLLAERLLTTVLCSAPSVQGACGRCRDCTLLAAGTHPDLLRVTPEEGARQIKIDQIRDVADFVMRTASHATRKVVLIDPADAMNVNAANSLLKSLEEPSPRTHLVLVSDAPSRLLPTLRSRCDQLRCRLPETAIARAWLADVCADAHPDALIAAGGRPLLARDIAEQGGLERLGRTARLLVDAIDPNAWLMDIAAELEGIGAVESLRWAGVFLLDVSRGIQASSDAGLHCVGGARDALVGRANPAHLARMQARIQGSLRDLASGANPNPKLVLEALLEDWQAGFR